MCHGGIFILNKEFDPTMTHPPNQLGKYLLIFFYFFELLLNKNFSGDLGLNLQSEMAQAKGLKELSISIYLMKTCKNMET